MAISQSKFKKAPATGYETDNLIEAINLGSTLAVLNLLRDFNDKKVIIALDSIQIRIAVATDDLPSLLNKFDKSGSLRLSVFEAVEIGAIVNAVNLNAAITEAIDFKRELATGSLHDKVVVIDLEGKPGTWDSAQLQESRYAMVKFLMHEGLYEEITSETLLDVSSPLRPDVKALIADYLLKKSVSQKNDTDKLILPIGAKRMRI